MRKSEALKLAFEDHCGRHGLKQDWFRSHEAGRASLFVRGGLYILETTHVSDCKHVPGRTGYAYPAGVRGLTDAAMAAWLREH